MLPSILISYMKVVLSSSMEFIGGEVLTQCLNYLSITFIIVLAHRDSGDLAENSKAKVTIVKDFISYNKFIINELKTTNAII